MDVGNRRSPAVDVSARVPRRNLGMITLADGDYPLIDVGPWVASTTIDGSAIPVTYQAGNLVEHAGTPYVALPVDGNTAIEPPNSSYWLRFLDSAHFLRGDRTWTPVIRVLHVVIDGSGSAITTGIKGEARVDMDCVIVGWTLLGDQTGSIVIDVWKAPFSGYPPTVANTITGSEKPTLSSAAKNSSTTLAGWTTQVDAGDTFRFNVDSATTVTRATLALKLR